ncbi:MAG: putative Signal transduction histidine kinase [Promethearchaeota archaeon]|nr:MAG: putative Signal transduction histidine kinase [Candidatus Lokiarchaeota archaeon]
MGSLKSFEDLYSKLFRIKASDSDTVRNEKILNILLIVLFFINILFVIFILFITGFRHIEDPELMTLITISGFMFLAIFIIFIVNRYTSTSIASIFFLLFLIIIIISSDRPEELVSGRSLISWVIPVILGSFLIKPIASTIIATIEIFIIRIIALLYGLPVSIPSLFVLFFISLIIWFSARTLNNTMSFLSKSRKKYERAYQRINFYKDIFTHDIGNILQNLQSSVDLFQLYWNEPKKVEDIKEILNIFNSQVKRAEKLITNVKRISDIEDERTKIKNVNVLSILKKVISQINILYKSKNLEINLSSYKERNILVKANDFLLDVFDNILSNAVIHNKNTPKKIMIKISEVLEKNQEYVKFEIMDNGVGIESSMKKKIFERGPIKIEAKRGIGLGLPICKKIIDLYKGKIWVEDRIEGQPNKGSNFIILIPKT